MQRASFATKTCQLSIFAILLSAGIAMPLGRAAHAQGVADATSCISQSPLSASRERGLLWRQQPGVVIVSRETDFRLQDTRDAIDHWNQKLQAIGSGLQLGPVRVVTDITAEDSAYAAKLSRFVLNRQRNLPELPPVKFKTYCGNIVIVLADTKFISFSRVISRYGISFIGLKGGQHYPFGLPNVSRNIIAHEIGHSLGIRHNADGTTLMCGRPAPCRPDTQFRSATPRFFSLTDGEEDMLRRRYPAGWSGGHP